jgi:predicted small lipoprotein YifL
MRKPTAILLLMALTACGQKTALLPKAGDSLPVAPYGREVQPSSAALLEPPTQAIPGRSSELRKRSEERGDDPFDLAPSE